MAFKALTLIAIFVTNFKICQSKRYDNYSLYNVVPQTPEHLTFLQNVEEQRYMELIYWKVPHKMHYTVQMLVNPTDKGLFLERTKHYKMDVQLLSDDIQREFDNQIIRRYLRLRDDTYSWNSYHSLEDINQWLTDLAVKYPSIVELEIIGKTAENREIFALALHKAPKSSTKSTVIVEGGIHGNEWVATEFVNYLIYQLIHTEDLTLSSLSVKYNWYFIPVLNPDGYDYSQKVDRLWKKNRRAVGLSVGVNLDRNFDYSFGKYDVGKNPRDSNYPGPNPASEPETKALVDFVWKKKDHLKFYFSIHAYGQKIVIPYGDRINHVDNYSEMENYAKQALIRMFRWGGVKYETGTTYDTLGLRISGESTSWVKKTFKVPYVFTFLLRDNGTYGYALQPDQILPTCKEALVGLTEIMTAKPRYLRSDIFSRATQAAPSLLLVLFVLVF